MQKIKDTIINLFPEHYIEFFQKIPMDLKVISEMGPFRFGVFIILIFFAWLILIISYKALYKRENNLLLVIKEFFSRHIIYFILLTFFSFIISFIFAYNYPDNYIFFYKATTSETVIFYNPFFICLLYILSVVLFYVFAFLLFESKNLAFFSSLLWLLSSFHLMNLLSSPLRDYIKAPIFILNFILIFLIFKNSSNNFLVRIILSALVYSTFILFKTDLYILFPLYIFVILANGNYHFLQRIYGSLFFIAISFSFILLTYVPGRGYQRLGGSLSHEMYPELNVLKSIGIIGDGTMKIQSCISHGCNMFYGYFSYILGNLSEMAIKSIIAFKTILLIPFSYGILPPINNFLSNLFYYKFLLLKNIIFFENLYLLIVFVTFILFVYKFKNFKYIYFALLIYALCSIYSLQFFGRHYFFLEIFSIIVFVGVVNSIRQVIKNIKIKGVNKNA